MNWTGFQTFYPPINGVGTGQSYPSFTTNTHGFNAPNPLQNNYPPVVSAHAAAPRFNLNAPYSQPSQLQIQPSSTYVNQSNFASVGSTFQPVSQCAPTTLPRTQPSSIYINQSNFASVGTTFQPVSQGAPTASPRTPALPQTVNRHPSLSDNATRGFISATHSPMFQPKCFPFSSVQQTSQSTPQQFPPDRADLISLYAPKAPCQIHQQNNEAFPPVPAVPSECPTTNFTQPLSQNNFTQLSNQTGFSNTVNGNRYIPLFMNTSNTQAPNQNYAIQNSGLQSGGSLEAHSTNHNSPTITGLPPATQSAEGNQQKNQQASQMSKKTSTITLTNRPVKLPLIKPKSTDSVAASSSKPPSDVSVFKVQQSVVNTDTQLTALSSQPNDVSAFKVQKTVGNSNSHTIVQCEKTTVKSPILRSQPLEQNGNNSVPEKGHPAVEQQAHPQNYVCPICFKILKEAVEFLDHIERHSRADMGLETSDNTTLESCQVLSRLPSESTKKRASDSIDGRQAGPPQKSLKKSPPKGIDSTSKSSVNTQVKPTQTKRAESSPGITNRVQLADKSSPLNFTSPEPPVNRGKSRSHTESANKPQINRQGVTQTVSSPKNTASDMPEIHEDESLTIMGDDNDILCVVTRNNENNPDEILDLTEIDDNDSTGTNVNSSHTAITKDVHTIMDDNNDILCVVTRNTDSNEDEILDLTGNDDNFSEDPGNQNEKTIAKGRESRTPSQNKNGDETTPNRKENEKTPSVQKDGGKIASKSKIGAKMTPNSQESGKTSTKNKNLKKTRPNNNEHEKSTTGSEPGTTKKSQPEKPEASFEQMIVILDDADCQSLIPEGNNEKHSSVVPSTDKETTTTTATQVDSSNHDPEQSVSSEDISDNKDNPSKENANGQVQLEDSGNDLVDYLCGQCNFEGKSEKSLMRHVQAHNQTLKSCRYCNKVFERPFDLIRHQKRHEVNMQKNDGSPSMMSGGRLLSSRTSNTDSQIFSCCKCNYKTSKNHKLALHNKQTHNVKYTCRFCSMVFISKLSLSNHVKRCDGNKQNACNSQSSKQKNNKDRSSPKQPSVVREAELATSPTNDKTKNKSTPVANQATAKHSKARLLGTSSNMVCDPPSVNNDPCQPDEAQRNSVCTPQIWAGIGRVDSFVNDVLISSRLVNVSVTDGNEVTISNEAVEEGMFNTSGIPTCARFGEIKRLLELRMKPKPALVCVAAPTANKPRASTKSACVTLVNHGNPAQLNVPLPSVVPPQVLDKAPNTTLPNSGNSACVDQLPELPFYENPICVISGSTSLAGEPTAQDNNPPQCAKSTSQLAESATQLEQSTSQLAESTSQLAESTSQRAESTSQLAESTSQLAESTSQLAESTTEARPVASQSKAKKVSPADATEADDQTAVLSPVTLHEKSSFTNSRSATLLGASDAQMTSPSKATDENAGSSRSKNCKYYCERCRYGTNVQAKMTQHLEVSHTGRFICKHCDKACLKSTDLYRHWVTHNIRADNGELACDSCSFTSPSKEVIEEHMRIHYSTPNSGPRDVCNLCGKSVARHMMKLHKCFYRNKHTKNATLSATKSAKPAPAHNRSASFPISLQYYARLLASTDATNNNNIRKRPPTPAKASSSAAEVSNASNSPGRSSSGKSSPQSSKKKHKFKYRCRFCKKTFTTLYYKNKHEAKHNLSGHSVLENGAAPSKTASATVVKDACKRLFESV